MTDSAPQPGITDLFTRLHWEDYRAGLSSTTEKCHDGTSKIGLPLARIFHFSRIDGTEVAAMSNVAGKTYGMNVITPMRPWRTWINRALFMVSRAIPRTLQGLLGLSIIHFARWVIIKRDQWPDRGQGKQKLRNDYMLFCSNFNGTWDQYIDAFSDGIPSGLDLLWYSSTKYPHSIPITAFKNYIRANQIDTDYYYNSVPGAAQRDVKSALRVRRAVLDLAARHGSLSPAEFQKLYITTLIGVQNDPAQVGIQNDLGYQGYAPIASEDTKNADKNREDFVQTQNKAAAALV
jgi:hypothetical protein